jgi:large subunit ribosomal protein L18
MAFSKQARRLKIRKRIRKHVLGTSERPRLSVFRSNVNIYAQIIDDSTGKTLVSASSLIKEIRENKGITKKDQAGLVGKVIAQKAIDAGITTVKFDRNGYLYHGRIKQLADSAREGGLKL